jgi:membrane-bound lytic murein transglycosylase D
VIPGDHKAYTLVLPTEKMYAFIDRNIDIVNYEKGRYFTHRANTEGFLDGSVSVSGNTANVYYRVKKGDNLSTIAQRNGTTVTLLKSWNGLTSTKLSIGKQLIVGKKAIPAPEPETKPESKPETKLESSAEAKPEPQPKPEEKEYIRTETQGGNNVISSYLRGQIEKAG